MTVFSNQIVGTLHNLEFDNDKAFKFYRFMAVDVPGRWARSGRVKYVVLRSVHLFGKDSSIPCFAGETAQGKLMQGLLSLA